MAESVWYYARGDVERGPFTLPQIKALANASRLRPDDLVWKEGMENWTAAKEVPELFPSGRTGGDIPTNGTAGPAEATPTSASAEATTPRIDGEFHAALQRVVRVLAALGMVFVVGTQGCESLSQRRVTRLNAIAGIKAAENAGDAEAERSVAARAALDHEAAGFLRGVSLYFGLLVLLAGATGLMALSNRVERWLGVGMILVVLLGILMG